MISNTDRRDPGLPLHGLSQNEIKLWLAFPEVKRSYAASLVRVYREGCAVVSPTMYLFAMVSPGGGVHELQPPFKSIRRWQLANKPGVTQCACADFYDPENNGPWRLRQSDEHHPLCEFDRTSVAVFGRALESAKQNEANGKSFQERPDDWVRIRDEIREVMR